MKMLALLILLTGCAAHYEHYVELNQPPTLFNQDSINRYLLTKYKGQANEQARIIYYQDDKYLLDEVVQGGVNKVATNGLQIVVNCTIKKCNHVVLAHNHPGQYFGKASHIDLENADKFKEMMSQASIKSSYLVIGNSDANWLY